MNKWCEEVQTVMTTLNFTTDWEKKLNHTGLSFAQCEVDRKTEEITKAISHQFAIMIVRRFWLSFIEENLSSFAELHLQTTGSANN